MPVLGCLRPSPGEAVVVEDEFACAHEPPTPLTGVGLLGVGCVPFRERGALVCEPGT